MQRLGRMRVGPHRLDGEVGRDVGVHEGQEGERQQRQLGERGGLGNGHQPLVTRTRAPDRQRRLHDGHRQRQHDGEMSELDDHAQCSAALPPPSYTPKLRRKGRGRQAFRMVAERSDTTYTASPSTSSNRARIAFSRTGLAIFLLVRSVT